MTSVNDVRGATAYAYTARSQMQRETLPDGTSAYYEYDAAGNRTVITVTGVGSTYYVYRCLGQLGCPVFGASVLSSMNASYSFCPSLRRCLSSRARKVRGRSWTE